MKDVALLVRALQQVLVLKIHLMQVMKKKRTCLDVDRLEAMAKQLMGFRPSTRQSESNALLLMALVAWSRRVTARQMINRTKQAQTSAPKKHTQKFRKLIRQLLNYIIISKRDRIWNKPVLRQH